MVQANCLSEWKPSTVELNFQRFDSLPKLHQELQMETIIRIQLLKRRHVMVSDGTGVWYKLMSETLVRKKTSIGLWQKLSLRVWRDRKSFWIGNSVCLFPSSCLRHEFVSIQFISELLSNIFFLLSSVTAYVLFRISGTVLVKWWIVWKYSFERSVVWPSGWT